MQSPCVLICRIDADSDLCLGCGRTLTEIAGWSQYDDGERSEIMTRLPARLAELRPTLDAGE
ncbi:DUF1289 domain-containing protein [Rhizobium sp. HT1-10]|uniref:DUF1289 domain-containing protein n=1 Tax=Rhizobium sp. HT1-10 TaxID=3111638 RepID=UPI003C28B7AA